jgi:hypothetical protein
MHKILELLKQIPNGKDGEEVDSVLATDIMFEVNKFKRTCGGHFDGFNDSYTRSDALNYEIVLTDAGGFKGDPNRKKQPRTLEQKYEHWRYW